MSTTRLSLSFILGLALAGCGSETKNPDTGTTTPDGGGPVGSLTCNAQKSDCKDFVFDSITVPDSNTASKYAVDLNGDGQADNGLGKLLGLFSTGGSTTLQDGTDSSVASGQTLILMRLGATDFANATSAKAQTWLGAKTPCCTSTTDVAACKTEAATTCFNGTKELAPDAASPANAVFAGKISGGALDFGPGAMTLSLKFGTSGLDLNLTRVRIKGTLAGGKITGGILAGGLAGNEINALLPQIASIMTTYLTDPNTTANVKNFLGTFDKNKDNKVETSEIQNDPVISTVISGDVDTNNDGKMDMLSLGIGYTAVGAVISK